MLGLMMSEPEILFPEGFVPAHVSSSSQGNAKNKLGLNVERLTLHIIGRVAMIAAFRSLSEVLLRMNKSSKIICRSDFLCFGR